MVTFDLSWLLPAAMIELLQCSRCYATISHLLFCRSAPRVAQLVLVSAASSAVVFAGDVSSSCRRLTPPLGGKCSSASCGPECRMWPCCVATHPKFWRRACMVSPYLPCASCLSTTCNLVCGFSSLATRQVCLPAMAHCPVNRTSAWLHVVVAPMFVVATVVRGAAPFRFRSRLSVAQQG
jgi:hypothetical protein